MKINSIEARNILEQERANAKEDMWIEHCICVGDSAGRIAQALKEKGLEVVLINSNPATLMTDHAMADEIYIEPLTLETVQRIIEKEKQDSLLSTLGGQTV